MTVCLSSARTLPERIWKMRKFLWMIPIVLLFTAIGSPSARADTTYTYTGNPFTSAESGYTFVTVSFTVPSPLIYFSDFSVPGIVPESFSFSDGVNTIAPSTPGFYGVLIDLLTNASGIPTQWTVFAETYYGEISTLFLPPALDDDSAGPAVVLLTGYPGYQEQFAYNRNTPGTWALTTTGTTVPEPSAFMLTLSGLLFTLISVLFTRNRIGQGVR